MGDNKELINCELCHTIAQMLAVLSVAGLVISVSLSSSIVVEGINNLQVHMDNQTNSTDFTQGSFNKFRKTVLPFNISPPVIGEIGIITIITRPLGCIILGFLLDILGRKYLLILLTFFQLVSWLMFLGEYNAETLFIAVVLMHITIGFKDYAINCYIGEITDPHLRGILSNLPDIFTGLGKFMKPLFQNTQDMKLRESVVAPPVLGILSLLWVPQSPAWLQTKGKRNDAKRSCRWLKGWDHCRLCEDGVDHHLTENGVFSPDTDSLWQTLTDPGVAMSFLIVILYMFVAEICGLRAMKTLMFPKLSTYVSEREWYNWMEITAGIIMATSSTTLGRRGLTFVSLGLNITCCLSVAIYFFCMGSVGEVVLALYTFSHYCWCLGISSIYMKLVSELFPIRVRGLVGGICGAAGFLFETLVAIISKQLFSLLSLGWIHLLFVAVGVLGFAFLYRYMPETEGQSLKTIQRQISRRYSTRRSMIEGNTLFRGTIRMKELQDNNSVSDMDCRSRYEEIS